MKKFFKIFIFYFLVFLVGGVFIFFLSKIVKAEVIFFENFNNYSKNQKLCDQEKWFCTNRDYSTFYVSSETYSSFPYSILLSPPTHYGDAIITFFNHNFDYFIFSIDFFNFCPSTSNWNCGTIHWNYALPPQIIYYTAAEISTCEYSCGTWHKLKVLFDNSQKKYKFQVDENSWSDWISYLHTSTPNVNSIAIYSGIANPNYKFFFDDIKVCSDIDYVLLKNLDFETQPNPFKIKFSYNINTDFDFLGFQIYSQDNTATDTLEIYQPKDFLPVDTENELLFFTTLPTKKTYKYRIYLRKNENYLYSQEKLIYLSDEPPYEPPYLPPAEEISIENFLKNYASNVPAIFGTTTPFSFYITITTGFLNFVNPFLNFVENTAKLFSTSSQLNFASSTIFLLAKLKTLNQFFNFPFEFLIFSIIFLLGFFAFKILIKIIRG